MLDEEEKNAALSDKKEAYVITLHLFVPTIFLSIHCHYTSYVVCHIIRHILHTNSINFSSISVDNQAGLIANKHSKQSGDDVITSRQELCGQ